MAYQKNRAPRYAKGFSEAYVFDVSSGDLLLYSNKFKTGNIATSMNNGAIEGGLGNRLLLNIPDTTRITGSFETADFSLEARGLQMGSTVQYNGVSLVREKITATTTTLTVSKTPTSAYGQATSEQVYNCYVGNDGVNYGVDKTTKQVQGFTAVVGQEYCVLYYAEILNAESLTVPASFAPIIGSMVIKTPIYSENGNSAMNSSLAGYLYNFYPRAQFIGGDAGINGSQTEASTTSWNFEVLAYDEADETCSECANDNSVYGYMVYVPCNQADTLSAVKGLAIVGGVLTVAEGSTVQTPVFYYMDNGQLITPTYADLTFTSATPATATVGTNTGVITGVAAGSTTITATVTAKPTLTATANVTVTAA